MDAIRRILQLFSISLILLVVVRGSDELDDLNELPHQGGSARQHQGLPVLGFVTPWNSRGKQLIEDHREKFDIVSPVWYTVHTSEDDLQVYEVRGGPPAPEDNDWYERLQKSSPSGAKPLQVTPRFILDGWNEDDFRNIIFNETKWQRLSSVIEQVVEKMSYDGVVFESGATQALSGPLRVLSEYLRDEEKTLVLVLPPIRTFSGLVDSEMLDAHNNMILQSISLLAEFTDYFSIMTYDMSGPGGHESRRQFPVDSQLHAAQQQHKVREPGPNTNAEWILANLKAFTDAASGQGEDIGDQHFRFKEEVSAKFLMGLPLYGYKYPVFLASSKLGTVVRSVSNTGDILAMLRGPGEPVVMTQIEDLILEHDVELLKSEDGEYYFDYSEQDGRWRVYLPTAASMSAILDALSNDQNQEIGAGVALWEVGQSSSELLTAL